MNRLNMHSMPSLLAVAPLEEALGNPAVRRLVVVVADVMEPALLAARIHQVAAAGAREVCLIGVTSAAVREAELRRKLALLSAFVREAGSPTEIRIENDLSWIPEFRLHLRAEDALACCVEGGSSIEAGRWIEVLTSRFQRDMLAFIDSSDTPVPPRRGLRLAPWLCSIALIAGFGYLQMSLAGRVGDPMTTTWLLASLPVEVAAIAWCNSVLS